VVAFQKRSVHFGVSACSVFAEIEKNYVIGSVGAVSFHKDLPPFGLGLTSVHENPYVPQTA